MIESVFQQAPFDEKLDDEIVKKIAKEYSDFKYISSGHCDKCGRFSAGQHDIVNCRFICKRCLFEENFERRYNEERAKLG